MRAAAGKGLEGDRYFFADGAEAGRALTLVEEENVEDVGLAPGATRRQLTTRGVRLNDLVGKRFRGGGHGSFHQCERIGALSFLQFSIVRGACPTI